MKIELQQDRDFKFIPTEDEDLKEVEYHLKNPTNERFDDLIDESDELDGLSLLDRKVTYNRLEEDLEEMIHGEGGINDTCEVLIRKSEKGPLHIKYNILYIFRDEDGEDTGKEPEIVGEISFKIKRPNYPDYPKYTT